MTVETLKGKIAEKMASRKELAQSTLDLAKNIQANRVTRRKLSGEVKELRSELSKELKTSRAEKKHKTAADRKAAAAVKKAAHVAAQKAKQAARDAKKAAKLAEKVVPAPAVPA